MFWHWYSVCSLYEEMSSLYVEKDKQISSSSEEEEEVARAVTLPWRALCKWIALLVLIIPV